MSDLAKISSRPHVPARIGRQGYEGGSEVKARASVSREGDDSQTRNALTRLDKHLAQGNGLKGDVPRGYYINILV